MCAHTFMERMCLCLGGERGMCAHTFMERMFLCLGGERGMCAAVDRAFSRMKYVVAARRGASDAEGRVATYGHGMRVGKQFVSGWRVSCGCCADVVGDIGASRR